jgi:hypothetical protein
VVAEDGESVTKDEDLKVLGSVATGKRARRWMERHNVR